MLTLYITRTIRLTQSKSLRFKFSKACYFADKLKPYTQILKENVMDASGKVTKVEQVKRTLNYNAGQELGLFARVQFGFKEWQVLIYTE